MARPPTHGSLMVFRKRKRERQRPNDDAAHQEAIANRLRSISESGGYDYSPDEREAVEARIRRMFYGAKKEGSKAEDGDDAS